MEDRLQLDHNPQRPQDPLSQTDSPTDMTTVAPVSHTEPRTVSRRPVGEPRADAHVRNPARLHLTHPNLTVISGELTDREAVQRPVSGADAVISALGPSLDRKATGMPLVDGLDAMRAEGVERYIGHGHPRPA